MATGDTSQTQYASLGYWSAYRHGFRIQPESLERLDALAAADAGSRAAVWGYQGTVAPSSQRVHQSRDRLLDARGRPGQHVDLRRPARRGAGRARDDVGLDGRRHADSKTCRPRCARRRAEAAKDQPAAGEDSHRAASTRPTSSQRSSWRGTGWSKNYTVDIGRLHALLPLRDRALSELLRAARTASPTKSPSGTTTATSICAKNQSTRTAAGTTVAAAPSTPRLPCLFLLAFDAEEHPGHARRRNARRRARHSGQRRRRHACAAIRSSSSRCKPKSTRCSR